MAGDWLKIEKATARKPEVLRIAELLAIHPDHAFGLCFRFWSWCDDQLAECNAVGVTENALDVTVGRDGFAKSLIQVGWLLVRNGSLEIPNFDRHLSESAKKRALSAKRTQKTRSNLSRSCNAPSVTHALPEKRREEYIESNRSRIESNRSVSPIGSSRFGLVLVDALKPKNSIDMQFVTLVGRAVDERHLSEALAQSALAGCDKARNRIAMFRSSLAGNIKAAGGDLQELLESLTGGSNASNES